MISHRFRFATALILLAFAALACSVPGLDAGSSNPAQSGGGAGGGAPADSGGSGDTFQYNGLNFETLSTYHGKFTMTWTGTDSNGAATDGQMTMDQVAQTNPYLSHITMTSTSVDPSGALSNFEMYFMDNQVYMLMTLPGQPAMCVNTSDTTDTPENSINPDTWLKNGNLSKAQRILPDEVINGINSKHFRLTQAESPDLAGLSTYTLDAWVSVDGNYPVKMVMVGDGLLREGGTGHTEWTWEILEVNIPVSITLPENCASAGANTSAGGGLPMMSDAANLSNAAGMTLYTTASSVEDVVAFYTTQMTAAGWTLETTNQMGSLTILVFNNGSQTANITVSNSNGTTQVMIQMQ